MQTCPYVKAPGISHDFESRLLVSHDFESRLLVSHDFESRLLVSHDFESRLLASHDFESRLLVSQTLSHTWYCILLLLAAFPRMCITTMARQTWDRRNEEAAFKKPQQSESTACACWCGLLVWAMCVVISSPEMLETSVFRDTWKVLLSIIPLKCGHPILIRPPNYSEARFVRCACVRFIFLLPHRAYEEGDHSPVLPEHRVWRDGKASGRHGPGRSHLQAKQQGQ